MESDALSVLAYSDEDLMSDQEGSVTGFVNPKNEVNKPFDDAGNQSNGTTVPPNSTDLYDPDSKYYS